MSYLINESKCPQNHRCPLLRVCPADAILQDGFGLPVIDKTKCTECGKCARFCPTGAIQK
jgi:ferredoxin